MPITAKLSRKFYETFGDELTNELVEWLPRLTASLWIATLVALTALIKL